MPPRRDRPDRDRDRLRGLRHFGAAGRHGLPGPIGSAITSAVVTYVLTLVGVYVASLIIDALAADLGGTKSPIQASRWRRTRATAAGWPASSRSCRGSGCSAFSACTRVPAVPGAAGADERWRKTAAVAYVVLVVVVEFVLMMMIGLLGSRFTGMQPMMLTGGRLRARDSRRGWDGPHERPAGTCRMSQSTTKSPPAASTKTRLHAIRSGEPSRIASTAGRNPRTTPA